MRLSTPQVSAMQLGAVIMVAILLGFALSAFVLSSSGDRAGVNTQHALRRVDAMRQYKDLLNGRLYIQSF